MKRKERGKDSGGFDDDDEKSDRRKSSDRRRLSLRGCHVAVPHQA